MTTRDDEGNEYHANIPERAQVFTPAQLRILSAPVADDPAARERIIADDRKTRAAAGERALEKVGEELAAAGITDADMEAANARMAQDQTPFELERLVDIGELQLGECKVERGKLGEYLIYRLSVSDYYGHEWRCIEVAAKCETDRECTCSAKAAARAAELSQVTS